MLSSFNIFYLFYIAPQHICRLFYIALFGLRQATEALDFELPVFVFPYPRHITVEEYGRHNYTRKIEHAAKIFGL